MALFVPSGKGNLGPIVFEAPSSGSPPCLLFVIVLPPSGVPGPRSDPGSSLSLPGPAVSLAQLLAAVVTRELD